MPNPLLALLKTGNQALKEAFTDLPPEAEGLPLVSASPCTGEACRRCVEACPTSAIVVIGETVTLDRGRCIGCSACLRECPTGTLVADRTTKTANRMREDLILSNAPPTVTEKTAPRPIFQRSLHVREVSTGDSASDFEAVAACNSQFDVARWGVHFVASPRHADALLVSGPVGLAMQDALRRCYDAMSEPRIVIALGTTAISGGLFADGYAHADGVDKILPVDCYIPGDPPHPWSIVYGLLLAMGRVD